MPSSFYLEQLPCPSLSHPLGSHYSMWGMQFYAHRQQLMYEEMYAEMESQHLEMCLGIWPCPDIQMCISGFILLNRVKADRGWYIIHDTSTKWICGVIYSKTKNFKRVTTELGTECWGLWAQGPEGQTAGPGRRHWLLKQMLRVTWWELCAIHVQ